MPSRAERADRAFTELHQAAAELARVALEAEQAAILRDVPAVTDAAEELLGLHVAWAEAYRTWLAGRIGPPQQRVPGESASI